MSFTNRMTSIHIKDTHRITSIHIKETYRITSIDYSIHTKDTNRTICIHMTRMNMFSVGKIIKYWLILFKIEVKKTILFDPMTGKKLIKGQILKNSFL
jgi:ethanolamine utilization protein EutA (predicted chaperonin)